MARKIPRQHKIAIMPHPDGTVSVAIALHRYRFQRTKGKLKWSLAIVNELMDFLYEPVPGVQIRPRLVLRIEGRPKKHERIKALEHVELHKLRRKSKAIW